jgi:hypothetical protein
MASSPAIVPTVSGQLSASGGRHWLGATHGGLDDQQIRRTERPVRFPHEPRHGKRGIRN